jgi:hypothetical protein
MEDAVRYCIFHQNKISIGNKSWSKETNFLSDIKEIFQTHPIRRQKWGVKVRFGRIERPSS